MQRRKAKKEDIPVIAQLLMDDPLGAVREGEDLAAYQKAFDKIHKEEQAEIYVIEDQGDVIACAQINYLTYLTYQGGIRAQIEGVRVHRDHRDKGVGAFLISQLIQEAKAQGCHMLQLTTDKRREEAVKFYQKLGFASSHEGMKLKLN